MNVLLAEAKVPYDIVLGWTRSATTWRTPIPLLVHRRQRLQSTRGVTMDDPGSPIAGIGVLPAWEARDVIVFKRSMATKRDAEVQEPLFFKENSQMLFRGRPRPKVERSSHAALLTSRTYEETVAIQQGIVAAEDLRPELDRSADGIPFDEPWRRPSPTSLAVPSPSGELDFLARATPAICGPERQQARRN
ncbi:MAG: NAD(P)(+) transhydrogenase (Re/Si-specific) subunit beta, partial [Tetrasphaera sp.]|nr:NAD(P)(+) transhydrogenase (Re/Si-specific) subunit beta [Tetrasphaera sp.]